MMALKKISMNISEELLSKIDVYAKSMGINRSSAISVLVSTQLQQQDALGTMKSLVEIVDKEQNSK
ncbi:hypothetical protein RO787_28930 [Blautia coccoides]|uniref:hypothetical protein n=1 Tax=Blautia producta TaxID=33035 RepID=UPI0028A359DD|nr:hypothetical protein [Blautia coccoides]MDT4377340.1 hypothetical protein [Blautia coccoides]